jgi:flagellar M-ring protein FliF
VQDVSSPSGVVTLLKYLLVAVVVLVALSLARSALRDLARAARAEPTLAMTGPAAAAGQAPAAAGYEADLRAVRDIARQEPRVVANVVKDWVSGQ